ncbi:MAG: UDP-N-acetylmuramate--L-alanine ligase, partial [Ginsengibacter sp.]
EQPIEGVSSGMILEKMKNKNRQMLTVPQLEKWVEEHDPEVFITAGAGDIDQLIEPLKNILIQKNK